MYRLIAALLLAATALPAWAQDAYPSRAVRIIVPFAAGGVIDVVTRIVADHMTTAMGRQFVVDNRPGAGSTIGTDAVAKAPPDGYTLLVNGAAHSVIPALYPQAPFDVVKDFEPVSLLGRVPFVLAIHPSTGVKDFAAFAAYVKANPGKVNFGTTGAGSAAHLSGELMRDLAKLDYVHVPYRGTPAAVTDLLSGQTTFMIDAQNLLAPHIRSGALNGVVITTLTRSSLLPELPTFDEAGVKGYDSSSWQAMYAPARTPKAIVDQLAAAVAAAVGDPAVKRRFEAGGIEQAPALGPAALAAFQKSETAKWGPIIKATGAVAN